MISGQVHHPAIRELLIPDTMLKKRPFTMLNSTSQMHVAVVFTTVILLFLEISYSWGVNKKII